MPLRRPTARRLTLAPTPAPPGVNEDEEVLWTEHASLSHGREARKLSAGPLAGHRPRTYVSKFWSFAEDLSSDEEEEDEVEDGRIQCHEQPDWPSAELTGTAWNAPATQPTVTELTTNGCLFASVAGSTPRNK
ncbi:unnamed protein product [Urochloa humidicola]